MLGAKFSSKYAKLVFILHVCFSINVTFLMTSIKKAVAATNPGVRTGAITLLGTLYIFMGKPLLMFFENEKPALRQQIEIECEKVNYCPPICDLN